MSEPQLDSAVAIVGMGALFPGAGSAPEFWRNIRAGADAISDVPPDRWDPGIYCDPEQARAGAFYTRRGGFLGELATFNPHPFGLMPASVDGTEPDQLLMLRAAAEAIGDGAALPDAPHLPPVQQMLDSLVIRAPQVPVWSATTLQPFPGDPGEIRELVLRHLVEPVRFRQLTELLHDTGFRAFVQVGPGSLTGFIEDTLSGRDFLTVATATPKRDGLAQLRRAAASLWAEGNRRPLPAAPARRG